MYSDPTRLRRNVVKVRFSDEEAALVNAWVNYTGEQKATLLRDLILSQAVESLVSNYPGNGPALLAPIEGASQVLLSA